MLTPTLDDVLDPLVDAFDEPFADASAIPTYYVSKAARQHVTVALTGDGGDEAFGGYDFRYDPHALEAQWRGVRAGRPGTRAGRLPGSAHWPRSRARAAAAARRQRARESGPRSGGRATTPICVS